MTYSLAITGANANSQFTAKPLQLADTNAITFGAMQQAMSQGTAFLCQGPDGAQAYYRLDEQRSTSSTPVLIKV